MSKQTEPVRVPRFLIANARWIPWTLLPLIVGLSLTPLPLNPGSRNVSATSEVVVIAAFLLFVVSMSGVGAFVATRRPSNVVPWLMMFASLWYALAAVSGTYVELAERQGTLPGLGVMALLGSVAWFPGIGIAGTFVLLLFPDGRLPSPRWRIVSWAAFVGLSLSVIGRAIIPGPLEDFDSPIENPLGIPGAAASGEFAAGLGLLLVAVSGLLSIASLVVRFRGASREVRQQMKWLVFSAAVILIGAFVSVAFENSSSETAVNYSNALVTTSFSLVPISIGVGILKYRLYDIDVVINKTIVFAVLAAFITAVYVAIVVGIGTILGSQDEPNIALSIAATAVVAIAFSPVKERTQRLANRLVYGHRLSPYEVLSDLSRRVATAPNPHDVLRGVAHAAVTGVNAKRAVVGLDLHDSGTVKAAWPEDAEDNQDADATLVITHRGEVLGSLVVTKGATDPITPQDDKLLGDLAGQAGLALHNARLALELQARLEEISAQAQELQSSRERIVTGADESRKTLEKDISSGPRRDLVAIHSGLEKARPLMERDPDAAASVLQELTGDANRTLDALRELARGIYPPLLADKGVAAALEAHIRKHELHVRLQAGEELTRTRFEETIETTAYFCCVEALRGVVSASLTMSLSADELSVRIEGVELSEERRQTIADRVAATEGRLAADAGTAAFVIPAAPRKSTDQADAAVAQASSS